MTSSHACIMLLVNDVITQSLIRAGSCEHHALTDLYGCYILGSSEVEHKSTAFFIHFVLVARPPPVLIETAILFIH